MHRTRSPCCARAASGHASARAAAGIVSKRKNSMYRFGRSPDWLKM